MVLYGTTWGREEEGEEELSCYKGVGNILDSIGACQGYKKVCASRLGGSAVRGGGSLS
jgi:hypothetical protein